MKCQGNSSCFEFLILICSLRCLEGVGRSRAVRRIGTRSQRPCSPGWFTTDARPIPGPQARFPLHFSLSLSWMLESLLHVVTSMPGMLTGKRLQCVCLRQSPLKRPCVTVWSNWANKSNRSIRRQGRYQIHDLNKGLFYMFHVLTWAWSGYNAITNKICWCWCFWHSMWQNFGKGNADFEIFRVSIPFKPEGFTLSFYVTLCHFLGPGRWRSGNANPRPKSCPVALKSVTFSGNAANCEEPGSWSTVDGHRDLPLESTGHIHSSTAPYPENPWNYTYLSCICRYDIID